MVISELKRKGKSEQYKVYCDEQYVCLLEAEIIVKNHIKINQEISEEDFLNMREQSEKITCSRYALDYVSSCLKTQKQVKDKLKEKGFLPQSINYAMDKLNEYNYLNDEFFAKSFISSLKDKKGKNYIKMQLSAKGVNRDIIEKLLTDFETEDSVIEEVCSKFLKNNETRDVKTKDKLIRRLISKGFTFEQVIPVVNKFFKGAQNDWD